MRVNLTFNATSHVTYGAPAVVELTYDLVLINDTALAVNVTVRWLAKTPTRLAESLWWSFNPHPNVRQQDGETDSGMR